MVHTVIFRAKFRESLFLSPFFLFHLPSNFIGSNFKVYPKSIQFLIFSFATTMTQLTICSYLDYSKNILPDLLASMLLFISTVRISERTAIVKSNSKPILYLLKGFLLKSVEMQNTYIFGSHKYLILV